MSHISTKLQNQILHKTLSPLDDKFHIFPDVSNIKLTRHFSTECDVYNTTDYDYIMKVILLGDQGVGKSSYTHALKVHPDVKKVKCMCRVAHAKDHLEIEAVSSLGKTALIRLCDTGGQERYRSLTSSYYRGAHGALLVFDLKSQKSLDNVETWLSDLETYSPASSCTRLLLGSNCTSKDREVLTQVARRYAEHRSMPYMEFDSTQFFNVVESLQFIVDTIAREVTVKPTHPQIIKPLPKSVARSHTEDRRQFTCLC